MKRKVKDATFPDDVVEALRNAKIIGVRAGTEHRYTGVWVVVVDDRVFVRSWSDKPTGWFRAFKKEPSGTVQVGSLEIPVRARQVRSVRIRDAVTKAFGEKYNTKASLEMGRGIRRTRASTDDIGVCCRMSAAIESSLPIILHADCPINCTVCRLALMET